MKLKLRETNNPLCSDRDYVVCQICGKKFKTLSYHIRNQHKITKEEYIQRFPEAKIFTKDISEKRSKAGIAYHNAYPKNENSIFCQLKIDGKTNELKELSKKGRDACIEKYGVEVLSELYSNLGKKNGHMAGKKSQEVLIKKYGKEGALDILRRAREISFKRHGTEHFRKIILEVGKNTRFDVRPDIKDRAVKKSAEVRKKNPTKYRNICKENGRKAYKTLRKRKNNKYDEEYFLSKEELECYKFLKSLGLSKEEINHDFQVDSKCIDFFPLRKFFWEYHPTFWLDNETPDQYYQRRRQLLDTNGYQDYKLIVTTSLKEMDIIERELNDQ